MKNKEELIMEWKEIYEFDEESNEEIWKEMTNLSHLYGEFDEDDEWYDIINVKLKDKYGVWFIDEEVMKRKINDAHMNTSNVNNMLLILARMIHKGIKKDIKWLEVIDKTKESFIGQNNY